MVTLNTDYERFLAVSTRLLDIHQRSLVLPFEYQKLIAENLMLRLFYEMDKCVEGFVLKLIRGAKYLDGNTPSLLIAAFSSQDAARNFILSKPKRKLYYLEWATLKKVQDNLSGIMNAGDHFLVTRSLYDGIYEDMRHVRNHIAHSTTSTKTKFSSVVRKVYPSTVGISSAKYLISQKPALIGYGGNEMIIVQYIKWSKTFIKTLCKSPI